MIFSVDQKQLPEIDSVDLTIVASNPSLASLIDQFDLPISKAKAGDDRSIAVNTKLRGNLDTIDVEGTLSVAGGTIALKGSSVLVENELSTFDMAVDIAGPDMAEFVRGLGVEFNPSNNGLGPLTLKMAASGTSSDLSLKNISGNIGATQVSGSGKITGLDAEVSEGQKSRFNFNLVLDDVPVKDFMEADSDADGEEWGNWSRKPMELAVLNEYDGRANITANSIQYDDYHFENPSFEAILENGVITISNFTGKLFGGDVSVAGTFSSEGDLNMDMALNNATIVDATTVFAGIRPVSGRFDMTQNISGKGTSQSALISSLNGTGEVVATPGAISGIDIPRLSEQLNGLNNQNGLIGLLGATLSGGETPYQGGKSTITMNDGFIQLSPFDIQMLGADSAINMAINMAEWKMNLAGDMALSDHPDAPPIGLSILGDIHNPEISYNTARLEGFIGQKIAVRLLQNMVEGNGGIGDLFGGITAPGGENPAPPTAEKDVTSSLLDVVVEEPEAEVEQVELEPEPKQETAEELGLKLLNRLFQKPPPTPPY
jgi:hypothetical protein